MSRCDAKWLSVAQTSVCVLLREDKDQNHAG
jgi:hypothetical protein